jgi:hypothetical protein
MSNAPVRRPPYTIDGGRIIYRRATSHGVVPVQLCNFVAKVSEEILLDDGVEETRVFVVDGRLDSGEQLPRVQVPAKQFASMAWVTERWGVRPVLHAGYSHRDHLRAAIQCLSPDARHRRVFTHTGWCRVGDGWTYLTAAGALGSTAAEVRLDDGLEHYRLSHETQDIKTAMRASLRLLRLAPLTVTAPLWAAAFRAPLASILPIDVSLWLEGHTGSLKSSLAALLLSHFGDFDRVRLPGSWSSTANQLERRAFVLKDALFVIDDYAPKGGLDERELQAKAARVLRAQGNLSGRGRLRADLSDQSAFPPRGMILATGEQHPTGQSILARTFLVQLKRSDVNLPLLTLMQQRQHLLSEAMARYLTWIAPQIPILIETLRERFLEIRQHAATLNGHLRVPEAMSHFWLGFELAMHFAQEVGAIAESEADRLGNDAWQALLTVGEAQGRVVHEERPTLRFLQLLATLVTQGRAFLLPKEEGTGAAKDRAEFVGWYDDGFLYLLPDATFASVARFGREGGETFPIREERLRRELVEEGLSERDPNRTLKSVRIGEAVRRVLALSRSAIGDALGEAFPVVAIVTSPRE